MIAFCFIPYPAAQNMNFERTFELLKLVQHFIFESSRREFGFQGSVMIISSLSLEEQLLTLKMVL